MQIKTITTVAGINEIDFGNDGSQSTAHFYWLKNLGDSTLYVSANPNPIAEKDDVAELPAKGAVSVETDEGKIYVLGAGKVEIHRTNSKFCPFDWQSSGSGGGGGGSITVDSELSDTSTNPLQNKVTTAAIKEVNSALETKSDINHIHDISASGNPVVMDNLQGGVPFSKMVVSGKNLIGLAQAKALTGDNTNGFYIFDNTASRVIVQKLQPNTTYHLKKYDSGNRFRIVMFNNEPTNAADTTAIQLIYIDDGSISDYTLTTGEDHLWMVLATNYATSGDAIEPIVQLELGDTATTYEPPITGRELTVNVNGTDYTITPDTNPYIIPNDIRQQDGLNNISVSEGELSVVGVHKNAAVKKIWDEIGMDLLFDGTVTTGTNCITENINGYNFLYFYGNLSSVSGASGNVTGSLVIPKTARAISAGQSLVVTTGVIYITVNIINIESGVITFTVTPSDSNREIHEFKVFGIK